MTVVVRLRGALLCAALIVGASSVASAQELLAAAPAASLFDLPAPASIPSQPSALFVPSVADTAPRSLPEAGQSRGVLLPLYVSFATLQMLDVHSTLRGLDAGASEANPMVRGIVERPAAFVALKGGMAAATILLTDRLRGHSRPAAIITMIALNSLYATIAARNYAIVH